MSESFLNIAPDPQEEEGPVKMSSRFGAGDTDAEVDEKGAKGDNAKRKGSILEHAATFQIKGLSDLTSGSKEAEVRGPLHSFGPPSKDPQKYQTLTEGRLGFVIVF